MDGLRLSLAVLAAAGRRGAVLQPPDPHASGRREVHRGRQHVMDPLDTRCCSNLSRVGPKTLPNEFYQVPHASGFGAVPGRVRRLPSGRSRQKAVGEGVH